MGLLFTQSYYGPAGKPLLEAEQREYEEEWRGVKEMAMGSLLNNQALGRKVFRTRRLSAERRIIQGGPDLESEFVWDV
jgi:hypothetical protein